MKVHVDKHFLGLCLLLFLLHILDRLSTDFRFESNPVVVPTSYFEAEPTDLRKERKKEKISNDA